MAGTSPCTSSSTSPAYSSQSRGSITSRSWLTTSRSAPCRFVRLKRPGTRHDQLADQPREHVGLHRHLRHHGRRKRRLADLERERCAALGGGRVTRDTPTWV